MGELTAVQQPVPPKRQPQLSPAMPARSLTQHSRSSQRLQHSSRPGFWRWCWTAGMASGLWICAVLKLLPASAAEQITLSYPPLRPFSISLKSLEDFARDGSVSGELAPLVKLAPPQRVSDLRELLQERFLVTPSVISQFATTQTGKTMFHHMGQILKTSNHTNGATALKTAFHQAAADPQGISLINLIRQFPDTSVVVDGQLGFQAIGEGLKVARNRNLVIAAIQNQALAAPAVTLPSQPDLRQPGPMQWRKLTLTVQNPTRSTNMQTVPADIYLPQGLAAPTPIVVISHGLASDRQTFAYLAAHLASHGFVVAVPEHPGSASQQIEGFLSGQLNYALIRGGAEILNRPLDVKYVLDELQRRTIAEPATWGNLDLQQVGVLGQSLGGYTALAIAGASLDFATLRQECPLLNTQVLSFNVSLPLQCTVVEAPVALAKKANFRDERIKAVIAVNPLTSLLLGQQGMAQISVPTLLVSGSDDVFAPPLDEQIIPFTWLTTPERFLVVQEKGTHFSFLGSDEEGVFPVPLDLTGPSPKLAQPGLEASSVAFFKTYIAHQPQYQPYLSQSYIGTLDQSPFEFDLIRSLTAEQIQAALRQPGEKRPGMAQEKTEMVQ